MNEERVNQAINHALVAVCAGAERDVDEALAALFEEGYQAMARAIAQWISFALDHTGQPVCVHIKTMSTDGAPGEIALVARLAERLFAALADGDSARAGRVFAEAVDAGCSRELTMLSLELSAQILIPALDRHDRARMN